MHSPFAHAATPACAPRTGTVAVCATVTITTTGTGTTGGAGCVSELD